MADVVLISCVKKKLKQKNRAKYLYTSPLFKKCLEYAETKLKPDNIFILSAKHGLLNLDDEIEYYDETLKNKNRKDQIQWAKSVFDSINKECDVKNDTFIFLAGSLYYNDLLAYLPHTKMPFGNMDFGNRLKWLNKELYG